MGKGANLLLRFQRFVEEHDLFRAGQTVIVGVSGGVDSMTLLDLLLKNATSWQLRLVVAHLNHQLRTRFADEDAAFVQQFCEHQDLEFYSETRDVRQYAHEKRLSLEMAGRELRYAFFQQLAERHAAAVIATAHTADDNAETIILNLLKGRSYSALSGIPVRRGNIVRPLLFATKSELYEYAQRQKIPFREDHTNRLTNTQRNVIRNQLLPLIEQTLNPQVKKTLSEHSWHWQATAEAIEQVCQEHLRRCLICQDKNLLVFERACLQNIPSALVREILIRTILGITGAYPLFPYHQIKRFLALLERGVVDKQVALNPRWLAYFDGDQVLILATQTAPMKEISVILGDKIETDLFKFYAELVPVPSDFYHRSGGTVEYIDFDKITTQLKLRPWRSGDRLRPLGMNGTRKVSDILTDKKIAAPLKKRIPLLVSGEQIIWVCGVVLSDDFKLTTTTKRALKIYYEDKIWKRQ